MKRATLADGAHQARDSLADDMLQAGRSIADEMMMPEIIKREGHCRKTKFSPRRVSVQFISVVSLVIVVQSIERTGGRQLYDNSKPSSV